MVINGGSTGGGGLKVVASGTGEGTKNLPEAAKFAIVNSTLGYSKSTIVVLPTGTIMYSDTCYATLSADGRTLTISRPSSGSGTLSATYAAFA